MAQRCSNPCWGRERSNRWKLHQGKGTLQLPSRGENIGEAIAPVGSMPCVEDVCIFLVTCRLAPFFFLFPFSFSAVFLFGWKDLERDQKAVSVKCVFGQQGILRGRTVQIFLNARSTFTRPKDFSFSRSLWQYGTILWIDLWSIDVLCPSSKWSIDVLCPSSKVQHFWYINIYISYSFHEFKPESLRRNTQHAEQGGLREFFDEAVLTVLLGAGGVFWVDDEWGLLRDTHEVRLPPWNCRRPT